jgi:hypothetical protein
MTPPTKKSRRVQAILFGVLFAAILLFALAPSAPSQTIEIAAIDQLEKGLLKEGFSLDEHIMMVDEIALGPANPAKTWVLSRLIPGYQNKAANRRYSQNNSRLGIDYGMVENQAVNIVVSCDKPLVPKAKAIAAGLSQRNPAASITIRVNTLPAPSMATGAR